MRPDVDAQPPDLGEVESTVRRAIDERRPDLLTLIGNGEFSIAMRWNHGDTSCVLKRVPPFRSAAAADEYVAATTRYVEVLRARSVRCVATQLLTLQRNDGTAVVYHCQPLLEPSTLADHVLRAADRASGTRIIEAVVDATVRVLDETTGFDAQVANWCVIDDELWQLDLSTPLNLNDRRFVQFDPSGFLREFPAAVRPLVLREFRKLVPMYTSVEFVLTDVLLNLHRERLDAWAPVVVDDARARHGIELSIEAAHKRFESDAAFWPRLLQLKRLQRGWLQRTGRNYDTLLPATTSFGR